MGKKYIIELEDKPFHKGNGDFLYRVKGFNSLVFDMTGINKLTPYTEPDLERVREEAFEEGKKQAKVQAELDVCHDIEKVAKENYKVGLSDAWEAARKIWKYDTTTLKAIFGEGIMRMDWFMNFTAAEAIEKLKAYEQEQDEIQVGDEVAFHHDDGRPDTVVVVTYIGQDGFIDGMDGRGTQYAHKNPKKWTKTGRHFPDIAEVLKRMRGEQDE